MGTLDRRMFLAALGACAAGAATGFAAETPPRKPNIVFILADDLGRRQVGCYGNTFFETPHLDALAAQGMRFTAAYAACPVCSPTRASIMTGKYPARLHITDYIPGKAHPYAKLKTPDWSKQLPLEETTLAEMLDGAGYVCGHFGKWHLSKKNDSQYVPGIPDMPERQGFSDVLVTSKPESEETAQAGASPDYDAHHAKEIVDRSIAFMEANREHPFFCYISHNLVHRPEMEFAPKIVKYATKPECCNKTGNNPVLGAMVETLDEHVGRVLQALDDLRLAENTLVVFFSDNGELYGREALDPFYGAKADLYEGGIREPMIVRWPGVVKPGTVCPDPVASIDFFPTFAAVAGAACDDPTVDGVNILPALTGTAPPAREALYWHYPHYHQLGIAPSGAIREGKYKLIEWFEQSVDGHETEGALMLFDLEADPGERHNLTPELPELAKRLYEKLKAWRKTVNAQEMVRNDRYDPARVDTE